MTIDEYAQVLASQIPPLSPEQVEAAARLLAPTESIEVAA